MASEVDELRAELEALRAENARLRESPPPPSEQAPPEKAPRRRNWWRGLISAVCIVLVGILVPVSIVGTWARAQLVSEDAFVATFAPLADDPDVQALVIDQATTAINDSLDIEGVTDDLFDGLQSLDLPPAAVTALGLLRAPAAAGVQSLIDAGVTRIVQSDAFPTVWRTALVASHRALVATATADDTGAVTIDDTGTLGIQLGPIIDELKTRLVDQGIGIASMIPTIDTTIVIVQSDALLLVGAVYGIADTVGWWLPFIALGLIALGILVARRRATATLGVGIALTIGAATLAIALTAAGAVLGLNAPALGVPARTLDGIYYTVVGAMRDTAVVFTFLGIVVIAAAWLGGRSSSATRVRGLSDSLSTGARRSLRTRGLNTGGFGDWLYAQRVLVRVVILALAIVLLFALRPLSIGDIVLTVVLALVVWLVAVLLQRHPDDGIDDGAPADADAVTADEEATPVDA